MMNTLLAILLFISNGASCCLKHSLFFFSSSIPIKGKYQLLACDGSSFSFTKNPKDPNSHFAPDGKTTNGYNQIHVVALFDLLSKRYCDAVIQPIRKRNEFQALATLIERQRIQNAIPVYIADRGFHAYNVFAHAIEKKL